MDYARQLSSVLIDLGDIVALFAVVLFASCERVAPNYAGVLMENYGKQGKEDFKIVAGKVSLIHISKH